MNIAGLELGPLATQWFWGWVAVTGALLAVGAVFGWTRISEARTSWKSPVMILVLIARLVNTRTAIYFALFGAGIVLLAIGGRHFYPEVIAQIVAR